MHIIKVTWQNRNDFKGILYCKHCEQTSIVSDGYADAYYQEQIIPNRFCPHCSLNEYGSKANAT